MPASVSEIVWSVEKAEVLLTVSVELPAASAMVSGLTATDNVGAASVIVTVCCVPMVTLLCVALIRMVSSPSLTMSAVAVIVVVADVSPAVSVSDSDAML